MGRKEEGPYSTSISGIKIISEIGIERFCFFFPPGQEKFSETLHRKCLVCEVMSVTLKPLLIPAWLQKKETALAKERLTCCQETSSHVALSSF